MRFIHTADWQIGKPFHLVEDPSYRTVLSNKRISSIRKIGELATTQQAEFVLVAGDLFDSVTPPKTLISETLAAIGTIQVPVYAIPGNHDAASPSSVWHQPFFKQLAETLAPNFKVFLDNQPVETDFVWVLPCPLLQRIDANDPTRWLRNKEVYEGLTNDKPRIALAHGAVFGFGSRYADEEADSGSSNIIQVDQLPRNEIDYLALGDWHGTFQVKPWAWYSGTPEFDRFKKGSDHDPGNVLLVDLADGPRRAGVTPNVQKIATSIAGWHSLEFALAGDDPIASLNAEVERLLNRRAMEDLLQLTVTGTINFEQYRRWQDWLDVLKARVIHLRLDDQVNSIPSDEELRAVETLGTRPLTGKVFEKLKEEAAQGGEAGEVARIAMRELYRFAHPNSA